MGVRIEDNLFYVESKNLSLIIENRDGYLILSIIMCKHSSRVAEF